MPPKKAASGEKKAKSSSSGGPKKKGPSPYNNMKQKLAEFKEKFPDMTHKERFKKVAEEWKTSSENPANKTEE